MKKIIFLLIPFNIFATLNIKTVKEKLQKGEYRPTDLVPSPELTQFQHGSYDPALTSNSSFNNNYTHEQEQLDEMQRLNISYARTLHELLLIDIGFSIKMLHYTKKHFRKKSFIPPGYTSLSFNHITTALKYWPKALQEQEKLYQNIFHTTPNNSLIYETAKKRAHDEIANIENARKKLKILYAVAEEEKSDILNDNFHKSHTKHKK